MGAIKSGNNIVVQGAGNTLASIKTDIADPTWFDEPTPNNYRMLGNRWLIIDPLADFTIGNSGDYSFTEGLQLVPVSGTVSARFNVMSQGQFNMYGNTYLKAGIDGPTQQPSALVQIYGGCTIQGDATYRPLITDAIVAYFNQIQNADYSTDQWVVQHVDMQDFYYHANATVWFISSFRYNPNGHIFEDVEIDSLTSYNPGAPDYGTFNGFAIDEDAEATSDYIQIKDCTVKHCRRPIETVDAILVLDNITLIENIESNFRPGSGTKFLPLIKSDLHYTEKGSYQGLVGQRFFFIDGGSSGPVTGQVITPRYSNMLIRDHASTEPDGFANVTRYSRVYYWTGNSKLGDWIVTEGHVIYCFALNLTIQDEDTNPVEDAVVQIRQVPDDREIWTFTTDANGKPINFRPLAGKVILGHKAWQSGGEGSEVFEMWSDGVSGRQHQVDAYKPGKGSRSVLVTMDQDRSLVLTLTGVAPAPVVVTAKTLNLESSWQ